MSSSAEIESRAAAALFAGPGDVCTLGRKLDWEATPLGSVEHWPQSLKSTVRTLLSSQYPMVLTWGPEFTQIYNDAYSKLIGDRHPAGFGDDIRITLAESWDILGPMIARVMASGSANWTPALPLEMHRAGYREEAYFSVSHAPAEDDEGRIVGMLAVCSEVTEQVIGERRLKLLRELGARAGDAREAAEAAEGLIAAMAEHPLDVPFGLLYLGEADRLTLAGRFGLPADAPFGGSASGDPGDGWPVDAILSGEVVSIDDVPGAVAVDGGFFSDPVTTALGLPVVGARGEALGALIVGVSPNRALDDAYRTFYELLGGQVSVAIRNARAREEERRRAEALAELDRSKTAFFANVSHEFRTPLTLMLGPLEEVLEAGDQLPHEERERITIAHRNALRLLKLVNALLDFSRIEAGRAQASYRPTDLAELTADLASSFRSAFEKAGVALVVDCAALSEPAFVDRDMWEKIVLNLLSNAFKFTFEGEVRVTLRTKQDRAVLTVADTGVGVPPDELPRLFERFHRIEGQRSRSFEGSGIGLALVQELVAMHGGAIKAHPGTGGVGLAVTVTVPLGAAHLPRQRIGAENDLATTATRADAFVEEALRWLPDRDDDLDAPPSRAMTLDDTGAGGRGANASVLVIDDNADMRGYVRRVLEGEGYRVETAADAEAALAMIGAGRLPDLVLSDVMMPGLDGFGLLAALRSDSTTAALPVVLVSARAGEEARVEGIRAGADDYLVKPFAPRELVARVEGQIRMARLRADAAVRESELKAALAAAQSRTALAESEVRAELALEAGRLGAWELDVETGAARRNLRHDQIFGYDALLPDWSYERFMSHVIEADRAHVAEAFRRALDTHRDWRFECRIQAVDGGLRWIEASGSPLGPNGDRPQRYAGVLADITERKRAEEHRRLLIDELNHRVKNTLAVVQGLARQTFKDHGASTRAFEGRLNALASAHDLLTRENWEAAQLADLAAAALDAHERGRIAIAGPPVRLEPRTAVTIAMALHELATNAAKYGALSNADGRVALTWEVADGSEPRLMMHWRETGGPPVERPQRRGFGSRMIERALAGELSGRVVLHFEPEGLACEIDAPLPTVGQALEDATT